MRLLEITEATQNISKPKELAVGIDLGTTNSLVAFARDNKAEVICDYLENSSSIPSRVFIDADNLLNTDNNEGAIYSVKRLIGRSYSEATNDKRIFCHFEGILEEENNTLKVRLGKALFTPEEISSAILKRLKKTAETHLKTEIKQAVITVPAYFDDKARSATIFAAKLAGLEVLRIISEPTAAAFAYGLDQKEEGYFLVYDLGGGTFDVSLLKMQMGVFQVLATEGDTLLGGDDFDELIKNHLIAQINAKDLSISEQKKIKQAACILKQMLASKEFASKEIELQGRAIKLELSIESFNSLINPLVDKTIKIVKNVISASEINAQDLKGIILVGGSTRVKLVKDSLKALNIPLFDGIDPDKVVALGAALQAENLTVGSDNLLIDVLPLSIGIELMGGLMEKIILRNTPIPFSVTKEFTTYADNQTAMQFTVLQGEREMSSDCRQITKFELKNIPPMKAGCAKIEVTFKIDADGVVFIVAQEKTTGIKQDVSLKPSFGLDMESMEAMLLDSYKNAEQDHNKKLLAQALFEAESLRDKLLVLMSGGGDLLGMEEKFIIINQIDRLNEALKVNIREHILEETKVLSDLANDFIMRMVNKDINSTLLGQKI